MNEGNKFFDIPMDKYDLDVVISLNNYHAGYAAVAHNPCLTIPIGLRKSNEPAGITFIGKSFSEQLLYEIGLYFEEDEYQSVVDIMISQKKEERERKSIIPRAPEGSCNPFSKGF